MKLTHGNKYFGISQSRLSKMICGKHRHLEILVFLYNVNQPKILTLLFHIVVAMATHSD